jgi:glutamyl-tRNA synthetase
MYDEEFFKGPRNYEYQKVTDKELINKILTLYMEKYYNEADDKQTWFDKIKDLAEEVGFAREVKEWKQNPENWPGHVGDISTVLRVALTSKCNTPDLYEIMQVLGRDSVVKRLNKAIG